MTGDTGYDQIVHGDVKTTDKVVLYIIKGTDQTSYINYIKPLILAQELQIEHVISVVDTTQEWFYKIHPERYLPALKDRDPETKQEYVAFESTACLQCLAERFDDNRDWLGRTAFEKAQVITWTAYQTAGLGPTAKYWLYFLKGYPNRQSPEPQEKVVEKLHENTIAQWNILEKRLWLPNQQYIALPNRPTIADISYFLFAMPWMFGFFGVKIEDWPHIADWAARMTARPAVAYVLNKGPTYGH